MGNNQTKKEEVSEEIIRTDEEKFLEEKIIETLEIVEIGKMYNQFKKYSSFNHNNYGRNYSEDCVFRPRDYPYIINYHDWTVMDIESPSVPKAKWDSREFNLDLTNDYPYHENLLRIMYYRIRKNEDDGNITYRMFFVTDTVNMTMKSGDKYLAKVVFCNTLVTNLDYSECKVYYTMEYMIPEVSSLAYPCARIPKDAFVPKFWLDNFEEVDIGIIKKRVEKDRVTEGDGKLTKATR